MKEDNLRHNILFLLSKRYTDNNESIQKLATKIKKLKTKIKQKSTDTVKLGETKSYTKLKTK